MKVPMLLKVRLWMAGLLLPKNFPKLFIVIDGDDPEQKLRFFGLFARRPYHTRSNCLEHYDYTDLVTTEEVGGKFAESLYN